MVISCASNGKPDRGEAAVPGVPQSAQDQRGGADGRDLLRRLKIVRSPGQNRRGPVSRMVTQPRLGRPHDPSGRFPRPAAGEAAGNPSLGSRNPAGQFRGAPVLRQIEERGQRRRLDQRGRAFPLRDGERLGLARRRSAGRKRAPSSSCRDRRRWKTGPPSRRGRVVRARGRATACGPETQSSTSGPSWRASSRVRACRVP